LTPSTKKPGGEGENMMNLRRTSHLITVAPTPRGTKSLPAISFVVVGVGGCSKNNSNALSSGTGTGTVLIRSAIGWFVH
jgi:hypothetical protein